jgi:hypothetical protein
MGKRARRQRAIGHDAPPRVCLGGHGTGDRLGPLAEAWMLDGPMAELVAVYQADTPEALQRVLLIPGRRSDTLCNDAVAAFRRVHANDDAGLVESVVLACTHHRWRTVGRPLLESLAEHGVLDAAHIARLAGVFLHDEQVRVIVPGAWLVQFYLQQRDGQMRKLDPAKTYTLHRIVSPQLRRWAARESVRGADDVAGVLRRALELDSGHGAAVVQGLIDAVGRLDEESAADLLAIVVDWPHASVRLPALKCLAGAGRHDEALQRAERDPAANVRRWAANTRQAGLLTDRGRPTVQAEHRVPQLSLFT